jgi:hypothetical protein
MYYRTKRSILFTCFTVLLLALSGSIAAQSLSVPYYERLTSIKKPN